MRPEQKARKRRGRRVEDRDSQAESAPPADVPERRKRLTLDKRDPASRFEATPPDDLGWSVDTRPPPSDLNLGTKGVVPTTRESADADRAPVTLASRARPSDAARYTALAAGEAPRLEATLTNLSHVEIPRVEFAFAHVDEDLARAEPLNADPAAQELTRKDRRRLRRQEREDQRTDKRQAKEDARAAADQAKIDRKNERRSRRGKMPLDSTDPGRSRPKSGKEEQKELKRRRNERKRQLDRHEVMAAGKVRAIRIGAVLWWAGLAAGTLYGWETGRLDDVTFLIPIIAGAVMALIQTALPWKRFVGRPIGAVASLLGILGVLGVVTTLARHVESPVIVFGFYVMVLAYASVVLPLWGYAVAGLGATAVYALSTWYATPVFDADTIFPVAALAVIASAVALTNLELVRYAREAAKRLVRLEVQQQGLRDRQRDLEALYEVSRTIGAGEALEKVIPELIERTAGYVNAKVGVMLLYRPKEDILDALSPIWAAGQPLEADGYHLPLSSKSGAVWAFRNGQPIAINEIPEGVTDPLIRDLGVERIAAVPLQIESRTIGVMMVADKPYDFDEDDLNTLELLAAPAALVLQSVVRLEASQETGRKMSELAQMKSDFVSVVSHELRTPLTSVIGALSTMSRPELAPSNPTASSLLDSARSQAQRLRVLIEDLLTVSKIDNQALPQRSELVEVHSFLEEMLTTGENWNAVSIDVSETVAPIHIDRDHLRRIITNLVDNARKYASESTIEIVAMETGGRVRILVVDHGQGVPFQYRETIFERFTQVEAAGTRGTGGTGLGLSIVRELAESMNGRAWYEPTVGGGATFVVEFPAATEHLAA